MLTTYERGIIDGERPTALMQLETKFGLLSAEVKVRLEVLSPEQLRQLLLDFAKGLTLKELSLQD